MYGPYIDKPPADLFEICRVVGVERREWTSADDPQNPMTRYIIIIIIIINSGTQDFKIPDIGCDFNAISRRERKFEEITNIPVRELWSCPQVQELKIWKIQI